MLIYYSMTAIIALYVSIHKNINKNDHRKKKFLYLAFGLMILIACLRSESVGRDLAGHYARNYGVIANLSSGEIRAISGSSGYGLGFIYFCKLLALVSDHPQWFIAVVSVIIYSYLGHFIYKYSSDVVMSTFIVIFSCTYYMYMNIIRQALAATIIMIGFEFLTSKKSRKSRYLIFTLCVLLATTFHLSALLCLVFILFDCLKFERRHIFLGIAGILLMYVSYDKVYRLAVSLTGNSQRYAAHIVSETEGVGGWSYIVVVNIVLTFGAFLIGCYSLVWRPHHNKANVQKLEPIQNESMLLYLCLMAGIFRLLTTQMNIMNRVTYYYIPFVFILYPLGIKKSGRYKKILQLGVYSLYTFYFVYVSVKLANDYYGTVPYAFFWQ